MTPSLRNTFKGVQFLLRNVLGLRRGDSMFPEKVLFLRRLKLERGVVARHCWGEG